MCRGRPRNGSDPEFWGSTRLAGFSERVARGKATPSCVIDFPYADWDPNGLNPNSLNLKGDDRLLERIICLGFIENTRVDIDGVGEVK